MDLGGGRIHDPFRTQHLQDQVALGLRQSGRAVAPRAWAGGEAPSVVLGNGGGGGSRTPRSADRDARSPGAHERDKLGNGGVDHFSVFVLLLLVES